MAVELAVEGAEQLVAVARALKAYGRADLKRELYAGLNRATKPLRQDARQRGSQRLPTGGGLAARVARTRLSARRRAGRDPGVRIVAAPNAVKDPAAIDRGRVRHPVFGHEWTVIQQVKPGWFSEPMEQGAPEARVELLKVLDDVARKVVLAQKAAPRKSKR